MSEVLSSTARSHCEYRQMPGLLPDVDPDGLLEYSVVFTDRSLNHMSKSFQQVMNDISTCLLYTSDAADECVNV